MATDLTRFLAGEPVTAAPDGTWKRTVRFAKTNPLLAGLTTLVFALTVVLAVVSWQSAQRMRELWKSESNQRIAAESARERADRMAEEALLEARLAQQVTTFLEKVFYTSDPVNKFVFGAPGFGSPDMTATDILAEAARRIDTDLAGQPRVQARRMGILGGVNCNLGRIEAARELLAKSRRLTASLEQQQPSVDLSRDRAVQLFHEGRLYHYIGEYEQALQRYTDSLDLCRARLADDEIRIAEIHLHTGWLYLEWHLSNQASKHIDAALELFQKHYPPNHPQLWVTRLLSAHCNRNEFAFGFTALRLVFSLPDTKAASALGKVTVAYIAKQWRWYGLALPLHRDILRIAEQRFSKSSRWYLLAAGDYADTLQRQATTLERLRFWNRLSSREEELHPITRI